jgi:ribosomal protein S18 acetylase RimI-like enzyme
MTLTFRPATDTDIDASYFAWGLNEAMNGFLDTMFGSRRQEIIAAAARVPSHDLSLEHVTVAEIDSQIVGMLSGMSVDVMADIVPALRQCAGIYILRAGLFYLAGWSIFRAMSRHTHAEWYLQAIAVSPEARGSGVGTKLLAIAEEKAQRRGCDRVTLDVVATNTDGIRLYKRLGYKREWTSSRSWLLGGVHVHRMSKTVRRRLVSAERFLSA